GPRDAGMPDVFDPTCGSPGQGCCGGSYCYGAEGCISWNGTHICGACGGLGQSCCPGNTCTTGRCASLYNTFVHSCVDSTAGANTGGGSCTGASAMCSGSLACLREVGTVDTFCVRCGGAGGEPCCFGPTCGARGCQATMAGVFVCR